MKLAGQVIFWAMVIVLLTLIFGNVSNRYIEAFYFVSMLLPVVVGTAYFFNHFLVPRYLFKKKRFKFILYTFYMLVISAYLEVMVMGLAFVLLAQYQYRNMIPVTTNLFVLGITLYCIVFLYGFILLVLRLFQNQQAIQQLEQEQDKPKLDALLVRVDRKMNMIPLHEICYLESLGDYVKIITNGATPIITKEKISALEEKLPQGFLRIHRSFIVNCDKIQSFSREEIQLLGSITLPISRTYKKNVINTLAKDA